MTPSPLVIEYSIGRNGVQVEYITLVGRDSNPYPKSVKISSIMIGNARLHRWCDPQSLVDTTQIVVHKVWRNRGFMVLDFL
jgi:hypothetical protein